jgi:phospholipid/cholesterol/gamma-HCH transport system ATP-binding protein
MNSVLEIGENVMFIHEGRKWWEGTRREILETNNREVVEFVYASSFMQTIREKANLK